VRIEGQDRPSLAPKKVQNGGFSLINFTLLTTVSHCRPERVYNSWFRRIPYNRRDAGAVMEREMMATAMHPPQHYPVLCVCVANFGMGSIQY
jgi:hypothetical protein